VQVHQPAGCNSNRDPDLAADAGIRNRGNLCVCEVCNCGKHHCARCEALKDHDCPFATATEQRTNFVEHPNQGQPRRRPATASRAESARFEGKTQYQHDYTRKLVLDPGAGNRRDGRHQGPSGDWIDPGSSRGIEGTTYSNHYKKPIGHKPTPRGRCKAVTGPWGDGSAHFDGMTQYQIDYTGKTMPRTAMIRGKANADAFGDVDPNGKFVGATTYGVYYTAPPLEPWRQQDAKAAREDPVRPTVPHPREWGTAHKDAYRGLQLPHECPVLRMPRVPGPRSGRHHTFWNQEKAEWV